MNTHLPSFRTVAALGAAVALTLAACSGDADTTTDTTADTTTDTAADTTTDTAAGPDESDAPEPAGETPATSPASLTLADQVGDGAGVVVDAIELPSPGFIAVHGDAGGSPGPVIGVSALLPAGTSSNVTVTLTEPLDSTATVFPMVHIDTDSNGVYEFGTVEGVDGPGVTAAGDVAVGPVVITVGDSGADGAASDGAAAAADDATITISDFSFSGVTEVALGTTVVVTNTDGTPHTWSAEDATFDSGALGQNETFEFTFDEPGEFAYFCNFHPSMQGTIVVIG